MTKLISNEEKYHLLTGRLFTTVSRYLSQNFKEADIDITKEQWTVLAVLWQQDGIPQQLIADVTGRDKPSTTRLLDNLEKNEYIRRESDQEDKRQKLIFLTPKAKKIRSTVDDSIDKTFTELTDGIAEKDLQTVRKVFGQIYQNIEKRENTEI